MAFLAGCEDNGEPVPSHDPDAPAAVKATPVFKERVEALRELLAPELPPCLTVRSVRILSIAWVWRYLGKGFGAAAQLRNSQEVSIRIGVWAWGESEESSNWREFTNVIEILEEEGAAGRLYKTEVYLFTDNSTV
jgi:hypothetical protein